MHRYQPGTTVAGHYTITGLLGSGGTSSVYRARDALMNRTVAIKILDKDNARLSARGFSVESRAAAVLSHPNIVNVYDILDTSDEKYIIMEYIYGITLREYLDHHGHLSVKESISCARQVLAALNAAHSHGIVHRDIKPGNILITTEGRIKVTDFGIARLPGKDSFLMPDRTVGTVHYISPEQAAGGSVDERSDLYSLGIVLYEMLTGRRPFEAADPAEVLSMQRTARPTPPTCLNPDIPGEVEKIILCALEKDPAARFDSAAEMIRLLDKLPGHSLTGAVRPLVADTSAYRRMTEKNNESTEHDLPRVLGNRRTIPEKKVPVGKVPLVGEVPLSRPVVSPARDTAKKEEKKREFAEKLAASEPAAAPYAERDVLASFTAHDTVDIMNLSSSARTAEAYTDDFSPLQRVPIGGQKNDSEAPGKQPRRETVKVRNAAAPEARHRGDGGHSSGGEKEEETPSPGKSRPSGKKPSSAAGDSRPYEILALVAAAVLLLILVVSIAVNASTPASKERAAGVSSPGQSVASVLPSADPGSLTAAGRDPGVFRADGAEAVALDAGHRLFTAIRDASAFLRGVTL